MSWKEVKLGELYTAYNGLSKSKKFFGTGDPFLTFSTVFNNYFLPRKLTEYVQSTIQEQQNYSICRGDVFITRTSEKSDELGLSCVALKDYPKATYNGFTKRLRPINPDCVVPEYIGYYMRMPAFRQEFQAFSTMTTRASLRNDDLLGLTVLLPNIKTQERIAGILRHYDFLIENNQKQIKLLEEAAHRLYKEWFIDLRFPGHENVEIVDGIPIGWHEDTIDTKVNLLNGFAFKSKNLEETGLFKLVTIKNVQDGYFEGKNVKYLSKIPDKMPKHCHLNEGDLLLSLTGNVGRVCIVDGDSFLLNQRVAKISSDTPAYTYCLFRSNDLFVKINNISNGAAQQNVSTIRIGQIKHWFPNDKLIIDFERLVSPILKRVVLMKKNIILLEEARDRLLPKLMSGEIEV